MKIEEYECVKIKRRAQARIYAETKASRPRNWLRITSGSPPPAARRQQAELRTRSQTKDQPAA